MNNMTPEELAEKLQGWFDCANNEGAADDAEQAIVFDAVRRLRREKAATEWANDPEQAYGAYEATDYQSIGDNLLAAMLAAEEKP
jgi:hypothetical protein